MALLTDQKVGGSSPSERATRLRRSGPPTGSTNPFAWAGLRCCGSQTDSQRRPTLPALFAIQTYLQRAYGLSISERTAEEINRHIGSAASPPYEGRVEVKGREVMSGLPKTVVLTSVEIRRAIEEP